MTEAGSNQSASERRRERRYGYGGQVRFRKLHTPGISSEEDTFKRARVLDISSRGMLIEADEPLQAGQHLEVFAGPDQDSHTISGLVEVVRCIPHRLVDEHYSEFYNPGTFVDYEVALKSAGSKLFDHIRKLFGDQAPG